MGYYIIYFTRLLDFLLCSNQIAVHSISKLEWGECDKVDKWPSRFKHDQELVIGCGSMNQSTPFHRPTVRADMYDAHKWFHRHGKDINLDYVNYTLTFLDGFSRTKFFKNTANNVTRRRSFSLSDCEVPGSISK